MADYGYLNAAQMMAVTGGVFGETGNELPTPDVEIHDTDYGGSARPLMLRNSAYDRSEAPPLVGYAEVYQHRGKWHCFVESDGGGSGSTGLETREEAVAYVHAMVESHRRFWEAKLNEYRKDGSSPKIIIAGGHWYTIGMEPGPKANRSCLGFGGHKFVFRLLSTGQEIVSHNVWSGGRIPREYLSYFPDNAEEITTSQ